ncbi:MAG: hypothetical protein UC662_07525, partial [Paraprevotella clara]|nr:hypothetical protein [Paraprevotella clara]
LPANVFLNFFVPFRERTILIFADEMNRFRVHSDLRVHSDTVHVLYAMGGEQVFLIGCKVFISRRFSNIEAVNKKNVFGGA